MSRQEGIGYKRFTASMIAALLTTACEGPTIDDRNASQIMGDFAAGRIELSRNNPIAAANVWSTHRAYGFWFNHQWTMLAKEIIENGYDDDLNWFYLGEAAKEAGFKEAARIYYKNAVIDANASDRNRKCLNFAEGTCSGFTFPRDAEKQLGLIGSLAAQPTNVASDP